eukprot:scaffold20061_cov129-Skeletonema_marinoi.AAC.4
MACAGSHQMRRFGQMNQSARVQKKNGLRYISAAGRLGSVPSKYLKNAIASKMSQSKSFDHLR